MLCSHSGTCAILPKVWAGAFQARYNGCFAGILFVLIFFICKQAANCSFKQSISFICGQALVLALPHWRIMVDRSVGAPFATLATAMVIHSWRLMHSYGGVPSSYIPQLTQGMHTPLQHAIHPPFSSPFSNVGLPPFTHAVMGSLQPSTTLTEQFCGAIPNGSANRLGLPCAYE